MGSALRSLLSSLGVPTFVAAFALSQLGCSILPEKRSFQARKPAVAVVREPQPQGEEIALMWPVASRKVTGEFKDRRSGHIHGGVDIAAPKGSRIYAPADGKVVYVGSAFNGYGKLIVIEHAEDIATFYGHCSKILVQEGEPVHKGSLIGLVGMTGDASAPHLHFEVRVDQKPVDPLEFLP